MRLWLSHPTGNANVRGVLDGLLRCGNDVQFFTTIGVAKEAAWPAMLPESARKQLARRTYDLPAERLRVSPALELARLAGLPGASIDRVYRSLDRRVACDLSRSSSRPQVVYAYEDGACEQFRAAERLGVHKAYDLPIAYWRKAHQLLEKEAERWPEWEPTLLATRDSDAKLQRKTEELQLADTILCPSRFVFDSLPREQRSKAVVSAFGSPKIPHLERISRGAKLRVLFAGSLTQRKGLADLFSAMLLLKRSDVELTILGAPVLPLQFYRGQFAEFVYESPRAHDGVLRVMARSDVLVLPSIVEGRALVQQEALACGLPIIVTKNAGGEDLVEEGRTGFLVPIGSPEAIAQKIAWFADHREDLEGLRDFCRAKAAEYTWENYSERLLTFIAQRVTPSRKETSPPKGICPSVLERLV